MMLQRKRFSARTGDVALIETTEEELNRPPPEPPNEAELAAGITVTKAQFSIRFRIVYAAEGEPLGPIAGDVATWLRGVILALPAGPAEALSIAQQAEALDRWTASDAIQRANPLIDLLAPLLFGDQAALGSADPAVALAELDRVGGVTDRLFIDAKEIA